VNKYAKICMEAILFSCTINVFVMLILIYQRGSIIVGEPNKTILIIELIVLFLTLIIYVPWWFNGVRNL
jgi:uncharacterized YccA/Bax inhibitor family protein